MLNKIKQFILGLFKKKDDTLGTFFRTTKTRTYGFISPSGSSGIFYEAGHYKAPVADANLNQGALTIAYGSANATYAGHAFIVAGGAGVVDAGVVGLKVTGTKIDDQGNRTAVNAEVLSADITTLSLNDYLEGDKYIGTITFELYVVSGSPVNYSLDFNYGYAKYDDFGNINFTIKDFEMEGRAGANDSGFNIELLHHKSTGWTYHATAFVPGTTALADMNIDHVTEVNLVNGDHFAYKRDNIDTSVAGRDSEGIIVRITTGANKAVESSSIQVSIIKNIN